MNMKLIALVLPIFVRRKPESRFLMLSPREKLLPITDKPMTLSHYQKRNLIPKAYTTLLVQNNLGMVLLSLLMLRFYLLLLLWMVLIYLRETIMQVVVKIFHHPEVHIPVGNKLDSVNAVVAGCRDSVLRVVVNAVHQFQGHAMICLLLEVHIPVNNSSNGESAAGIGCRAIVIRVVIAVGLLSNRSGICMIHAATCILTGHLESLAFDEQEACGQIA